MNKVNILIQFPADKLNLASQGVLNKSQNKNITKLHIQS